MSEVKICSKCSKELPVTDFHLNGKGRGKRYSACKHCRADYYQELKKRPGIEVEGKVCTKCGEYKQIDEFPKDSRAKDKHMSKCLVCTREYNKHYRTSDETSGLYAATKAKEIERRRHDPQYRVRHNVSRAVAKKLRMGGFVKTGSKIAYLDYTVPELMGHLEAQFEEGMNWNNYGLGENKWSIDHIIPDSHFHYTDVKDKAFSQSWALNNLKPMWFCENSSKGNRYCG